MIALALDGGGDGALGAIDGERVSFTASRAAAPGARLGAVLADGTRLRIKVHRCVREGERFALQGRLLDATRVLRDHLAQALAAVRGDVP